MFNFIKYETMTTPKGYELKRGVLLQAFGHPEKACTEKTLTDELAEWHLKFHPDCAKYFSRLPIQVVQSVPSGITIVSPVKNEEVKETAVNPVDEMTKVADSILTGKSPKKAGTKSQIKK